MVIRNDIVGFVKGIIVLVYITIIVFELDILR